MNNIVSHDLDDIHYASESPFSIESGILFKYGRFYLDRPLELDCFQKFYGIQLHDDFLWLIGNWCEGGFDGWYQVHKGEYGSIKWTHLFLMKIPDRVDYEYGSKYIISNIINQNTDLFIVGGSELRYFPIGNAICERTDGDWVEGFLAFDILRGYSINYLSYELPNHVPIARSFSGMMKKARLQFLG